jgi:hypothetical protein
MADDVHRSIYMFGYIANALGLVVAESRVLTDDLLIQGPKGQRLLKPHVDE